MQVFPSSLRIRSVDEAAAILERAQITGVRRTQLMDLVHHVMNAPIDAGVSTDALHCGIVVARRLAALAFDLDNAGSGVGKPHRAKRGGHSLFEGHDQQPRKRPLRHCVAGLIGQARPV